MQQIAALETGILLFLQEHVRSPFLTSLLRPITHLGDAGLFWILLTLALLAFKRTRKAGVCSMFALLCMLLTNNVLIKHLVNRPRPYTQIPGLTILVEKLKDSSFPSGHTAASFASGVALLLSLPMVTDRRKARIFAALILCLAVLIAFSRLYVGVHYPTDVLGGIVVGSLCGAAGYAIGKWLMRKK